MFKPDARILRTEHLETAERFFAKYGPFALVRGRFVPIVRSYVPLAAGTTALKYRRFVMWNVLGALVRWRRERKNGPPLEPIVADDASLLD